jgi:hypothetical protein
LDTTATEVSVIEATFRESLLSTVRWTLSTFHRQVDPLPLHRQVEASVFTPSLLSGRTSMDFVVPSTMTHRGGHLHTTLIYIPGRS